MSLLLKKKVDVVILSGGIGSRIRKISEGVPKSLIKINNKNILTYIFNEIKKYNFNKIYILDNQFVKKSKNSFGKFKINNEINFYSYILNNNIKFNTPKLIQQNDGEIILEYIEKSTTLTDKINRCNFLFFVNKIKEHLK